jgi:hypothetical protein
MRSNDLWQISDVGMRIFTQDLLMMRFTRHPSTGRAFDALLPNQQRLNAVQI